MKRLLIIALALLLAATAIACSTEQVPSSSNVPSGITPDSFQSPPPSSSQSSSREVVLPPSMRLRHAWEILDESGGIDAEAFIEKREENVFWDIVHFISYIDFPRREDVAPGQYLIAFESPEEFSSDNLFNFFLHACDPEDFYSKDRDNAIVPIEAVTEILSEYFESFVFEPEKVTFINHEYDSTEQCFILPALAGFGYGYRGFRITKVEAISQDMIAIHSPHFRDEDITTNEINYIKITGSNTFKFISREIEYMPEPNSSLDFTDTLGFAVVPVEPVLLPYKCEVIDGKYAALKIERGPDEYFFINIGKVEMLDVRGEREPTGSDEETVLIDGISVQILYSAEEFTQATWEKDGYLFCFQTKEEQYIYGKESFINMISSFVRNYTTVSK